MAPEKRVRTVLVIDDESSVRKMAKVRLESEGYRVLTATQGEMGLAMARVEHPDVILLDVLMPNMDGREVLRQLQADDTTRGIPVVLLSVIDPADSMSEPIGPGVAFHVPKPFETADLLKKLRLALAGVRHEPGGSATHA